MEKFLGDLFFGSFVIIGIISILGATLFSEEWKKHSSIEPFGFFYCGIIGMSLLVFGLLCASHGLQTVGQLFIK